jgi:branched-chain amino acid transport system permease protein
MSDTTTAEVPASLGPSVRRTTPAVRALPFLVALASPLILDNIGWNPFGGWKILVGLIILVCVGRFAWSTAERDPGDPRLALKLWHRPDQRALSAMTCLVIVSIPFILGTDFDPPMDFPWNTWFRIINYIILFALGAGAFNLLAGYTGQLSMAHAAFLMIGTMVGAHIGLIWEQSFWLCLPIAAVAGAALGALFGIPALRLRGLYLMLATIGAHFIVLLIWKEYMVHYFGFGGVRFTAPNLPSWLHWIPGINPEDGKFLINSQFRWFWVNLTITTLGLLFIVNVVRSREGRAFAAVRDRDISATLLGINVARSKLVSFALSSAMVSVSGCLLSYYNRARSEDSFNLEQVLDYGVIIVVGGFMGIQGAIFGSVFFFALPMYFEWMREELPLISNIDFFSRYAGEVDLAIRGILVVVVLVWRPDGLAGLWQSGKKRLLLRFNDSRTGTVQ